MNEAPVALNWGLAFFAGLLSFLSPCVAPIVPGYLSFVSGVAIGTEAAETRQTERVVIASVLFVLGFSLVFVALGVGAGALGSVLDGYRAALNRLSGLVMVVMGLFVLGLVRTPILYRERRLRLIDRPYGPIGTVLLGMAFGCGWTPCIGPILASILLYAGSADTAQDGGILLAVYSLGLGIPFIAAALGLSRATTALGRMKHHLQLANTVSGALLIGMGALFLANRGAYLTYLNVAAQRLLEAVAR